MVKLIAGLMGSSVQSGSTNISTTEQLSSFLTLLQNHNIKDLDTARVYNSGKSEDLIGTIPSARHHFTIATKAPGFSPGSLTHTNILSNCHKSLSALQQDSISLYYLHGPDRATPLEESCAAIQTLYSQGKILSFGLSNFSVDEVRQVHNICSSYLPSGGVLPTVYQGIYNPLSRAAESKLFPTLRELDIAFYAYSPLAGGFFSRATDQLREPPEAGSRYDQMKQFKDLYINELSLELHQMVSEICRKEGLALGAAALRFLVHHSALGKEDGVVLGASREAQMEENLSACEAGRLPEAVVEAFERLWERYEGHGYSGMYCV